MRLVLTFLLLQALTSPAGAFLGRSINETSKLHLDAVAAALPPENEEASHELKPHVVYHHGEHGTAAEGAASIPHHGHHDVLGSVHMLARYIIMPMAGCLIVCVVLANWLSLNSITAVIPDSAWTVMFSCILGLCMRMLVKDGRLPEEEVIMLTAQFLNLFLLPIIIFESGWSLKHFNFMSQLEYINVFAVLGTLISFGVVGFIGTWLGEAGYHVVKSRRSNFVFAALISAVDPVATLATFSKLGLDSSQPLLHTMIFGESVVNDAVAIVLFSTINEGWDELNWYTATCDISWLLFGSAGFGIFLSAALILLMRILALPGKSCPMVIFFASSAWFIYAAAEGNGFSGIIANLCAGSMFKMYGSKHLDHEGLEMATGFLEVMGHMCDALVFILVGICCAFIDGVSGPYFAAFAIVLCMLGRALSTMGCAFISNSMKTCMNGPENQRITARHQVIMWWSGLRGGIALVLVLQIGNWCKEKQALVNATFLVICCTLLLLGSTTEKMLDVCGFKETESTETTKGGEEAETGTSEEDEAEALMAETPEETTESQMTGAIETRSVSRKSLMGNIGKANVKTKFYVGLHKFWIYVLVGDEETNRAIRKRNSEFMHSRKQEALPAQRLSDAEKLRRQFS